MGTSMETPELPGGNDLVPSLLVAQENEATEAIVYDRLAQAVKDPAMRKVLQDIAREEQGHYAVWHRLTGREVPPSPWKLFKFVWIARIFGITFGIKLMEKGEALAQVEYARLAQALPEASRILQDEAKHEAELIGLLDEEKLRYLGSVVLGLSDALVELTGMLAGLSLAMQKRRVIALAGLITGIAATLSMTASQYLAVQADSDSEQSAVKAAAYTGGAFLCTVALLIAPYLLFSNFLVSLTCAMGLAILEIWVFVYYLSVAKDIPFRKRFWEMTLISVSVATVSFGIGYLVKILLNVEI